MRALAWLVHDLPMRGILLLLLLAILIVGGLKLAGLQLPVFEYPLGGPMAQPQIRIQQPNLNVP
jgi:hypothetical protein